MPNKPPFISTEGNHIILVRVPGFTQVVMRFHVSEINPQTIRHATQEAVKLMWKMLAENDAIESETEPQN